MGILVDEEAALDALYKQANASLRSGHAAQALEAYDRLLQAKPDFADALYNRGLALQGVKQHEAAIDSYDRAIALRPDDAEAFNNRGNALLDLKRFKEAFASYQRAVELKPGFAPALFNLGVVLQELKRPKEAVRCYAKLLRVEPGYPLGKGKLLHAKMLCCDWDGLDELEAAVRADLQAGVASAEPFGYLAVAQTAQDVRLCMELYVAQHIRHIADLGRPAVRHDNAKIRIGYACGEFRQQATSVLMVQLIERHDKKRFEVFAFDSGWDDRSGLRQRLEIAFDEIVDISRLGDAEAAALIQHHKIDILVDLNGYFGLARSSLFACKPAPIQVNYLGFPATTGAPYMDYILADRHVIPADDERWYTEKVVCLADTYQPNDSNRPVAPGTPRRPEAGLPEAGFVFCCFNNNWKITPQVFDVWMNLLRAVDGAVLWLLEDNAAASLNLRLAAQRRGISAQRLVFAPRLPLDQHLARHRLADLFLDTLPYNAHTTASDALWVGLPVLTCTGPTFAGRVAASLLHAIGLPDLVTHDLGRYQALALELATTPVRLAQIKARLERNRSTHPLFDSERICRHIESAYQTMWQRHQQGLPPQGFSVAQSGG